MPTNLDEARSAIASQIGADAAEFTPAGEKNFVAEAALMSMAGSFLFSFLKGVAKKAAEVAQNSAGESIGTAAGEAIGDLLNRLRHKEPPATEADLHAAQTEAVSAVRAEALSQAQIEAISKAVAAAMVEALTKRSDPEVTQRVVAAVRTEGLKAIAAGTA